MYNLHPYREGYTNINTNLSDPSHCIEIHRVGNNRTVNTSDSPHISDQFGAENAC